MTARTNTSCASQKGRRRRWKASGRSPCITSQYFFVTNPINRYSISPRQNLKANPDGSVDIYVQKDSPGADKESNWLPAPAGKFILMLRMYWPNENDPSILDGSWTVPPVTKAS